MLEIGIQNGGSLEIWSQYFPLAKKLVGCDIDPRCAQLRYEDPRIQVVVGDANAPDIQAQVLGHTDAFDIILDDGSHKSSDIIKSFARYFPHLQDGGIYIAEDLHCSYWQDWEGGLYDPQSSIAFFKLLADAINHEHWGVAGQRVTLFTDFVALQEAPLLEEALAHIHSVEFANSLCFIRKGKALDNLLGARLMAGTLELVSSGNRSRHNTALLVPDNSNNPRSHRAFNPVAQAYLDDESRARQIEVLQTESKSRMEHIANLETRVSLMLESRSWRMTAPIRFIGDQARRIASWVRPKGQTPK
jgi:hypothetical protein